MKVEFSFTVLEVGLVHHRRFVDVVVGCDAMIVRDFSKLPHVVHVVLADIDIEEDGVAILILLLH